MQYLLHDLIKLPLSERLDFIQRALETIASDGMDFGTHSSDQPDYSNFSIQQIRQDIAHRHQKTETNQSKN